MLAESQSWHHLARFSSENTRQQEEEAPKTKRFRNGWAVFLSEEPYAGQMAVKSALWAEMTDESKEGYVTRLRELASEGL